MKAYAIKTTAKPPKGNFQHYAPLMSHDKDERFLGGAKEFTGRPFPRQWRNVELYVSMPRLPRPDFFDFGGNVFVCNQRVVEVVGEPLEMSGELLRVTIEGEPGNYYIYNCTNCINVFDPKMATWGEPYGKKGEYRDFVMPGFHAERFGEECLFKIPEDGGHRIYCLERTGDADEGEFKALVERHKLTGLTFELVWTGRET